MPHDKTFKYADDLKRLPDCPPADYKEVSTVAFRWIHADIEHQNNFLPALKINPHRKLPNAQLACKGYGLSLYDDLGKAEEALQRQLARRRDFAEVVGTCVATLFIDPPDGAGSVPEQANFGHFTFHEYICCDFSKKVMSITDINTHGSDIES
jgi:hypothetical protein